MNFKITFRSMILRFCGVEENVNKLRHHSKTMFLLDKTCPKQLICDLLYFVHYLLLAPSCCITVNYQEIRRWSFFLKIVFSNYKLILELIQKTQKTKQCKDSMYTQISIISPFKKNHHCPVTFLNMYTFQKMALHTLQSAFLHFRDICTFLQPIEILHKNMPVFQ